MAKKKAGSRSRPNIPQDTLNRARRQAGMAAEVPAPVAEKPATNKAKAPVAKSSAVRNRQQAARPVATIEDLAKEYAYVTNDLRSMAILAAVLFVGLIALALVLQ